MKDWNDTKKPGKAYDSVAVSNDDIVNEMIEAIEKNEPCKKYAWLAIMEIGTKLKMYGKNHLIENTDADTRDLAALIEDYEDDCTYEED